MPLQLTVTLWPIAREVERERLILSREYSEGSARDRTERIVSFLVTSGSGWAEKRLAVVIDGASSRVVVVVRVSCSTMMSDE